MLPLKDRVVMRQLKALDKKGVLYIPEAQQKKPNVAIVLAVGPEVASVAEGDMVVLGTKWYTNFDMPGQGELLILNEPDLLGKVTIDERTAIEAEYGR